MQELITEKKSFEERQKKMVSCGGERKAFCMRVERVCNADAKKEQRANCLSREW